MYDYKFRQDEFGARKPKRRLGKLAIAVAVLVLIGGLIYLFTKPNLGLGLVGAEPDSGANANIIPLRLPPQSNSAPVE